MKHIHPIQLTALLAMTESLRVPVVIGGPIEQHPPEPPPVPPLGKTMASQQQRAYLAGRRFGRSQHMRDLMGEPVRAIAQRPSGDQNPEGKAAKRRRKQMERQKAAQLARAAADSCDPPRADRQDLAQRLAHYKAMLDSMTPEQIEQAQAAAHAACDISPELLEETVRDVTAELQRSGMVIIDDAGVVPPEVWLTESNPVPRYDWVQSALDVGNRVAFEANVERCKLKCAWKGGGPCLADDCPRRVKEQRKGDDHGDATADATADVPGVGPDQADPVGVRS